MEKYDPRKIEEKWQKIWAESGIYKDYSRGKKLYALDMFPYPSGAGLHVGHPKGYIATDVFARFKMLQGCSVLHPMGWDAFGLPAENYALEHKVHPEVSVRENIKTFKSQLEKFGFTYDWDREINTTNPEYYKWTQWIFLKMFERGLAYESDEPINWCPSCKTGLALEDLENGLCERCGSQVIQKKMRQWMLKMTDYADRLLKDLDIEKLDWEESIIEQQKNWIGRSEGAIVKFSLTGAQLPSEYFIEVFTTRLDTIFGCTYCVVGPEHKIIEQLKDKITNHKEVEEYIVKSQNKTELERTDLQKEKTGVKLGGIEVINPFNNKAVPLFIADYVLGHYGTGAVMAVPAHDERDFEFAKKYKLLVKQVIQNTDANVFVVHGSPREDRSKNPDFIPENIKHWLGWLKKVLEENGAKVFNPRMPKSWQPEYKEWKKEFEKNKVNENTTLIGHSAGGAFLVRWLGETKSRVKKLILVAPGRKLTEENTRLKKMYDFDLDKSISERVGEIIIFVSNENKPYKIENSKSYAKDLKGKLIELENRGHFTLKDNEINKELPELLKEVLESDCFIEDGTLLNSGKYSGMTSKKAREEMAEWLEKEKIGQRKVNFKMRDWVFSRQRYWGEPIPVVHCEKCGTVAVPEKDLPVRLPMVEKYEPTGTGEGPLANIPEWVNTKCPKCGGRAKRETNTMPQWAGSSWYYLRYIDPKNSEALVDKNKEKDWMPVDLYVGGAEHATRHLLYARFWHKFLYDIGVVSTKEPFQRLVHVGLINGEDGRKMSKRWGNVINPDGVIEKFGADSIRLYEMFMGPFTQNIAWSTKGVVGMRRFLEKVWKLGMRMVANDNIQMNANARLESLLHKTIKKVTEDIDNFRFNTAISSLMILLNELEKQKEIYRIHYTLYLILLSPFAPHIAEELWEKLGHKESIFLQKWPEPEQKYLKDEEITLVVQINGKVRDQMNVPAGVKEDEAKKLALAREKVIRYVEGKDIRKVVFVKDKLINFVI